MPNLRNVAEASGPDSMNAPVDEKSGGEVADIEDVAKRAKSKTSERSSSRAVNRGSGRLQDPGVFRKLPASKDLGDLEFDESKPYFVIRDDSKFCGGFASMDEAYEIAERPSIHPMRVIRRVHELPLSCQHVRF